MLGSQNKEGRNVRKAAIGNLTVMYFIATHSDFCWRCGVMLPWPVWRLLDSEQELRTELEWRQRLSSEATLPEAENAKNTFRDVVATCSEAKLLSCLENPKLSDKTKASRIESTYKMLTSVEKEFGLPEKSHSCMQVSVLARAGGGVALRC